MILEIKVTVQHAGAGELLEIQRALAHSIEIGKQIMGTLKEVQDAIAKVATDATAEKAEVATAIKELNDSIAALKAQIEAGTAATPADLDGLIASLGDIDAQVKDITVPTPVA